MHSDFMDKFKGKTNQVPKQGVVNLINAPHKKPPNQVLIKSNQVKRNENDSLNKKKCKKSKNSPSDKQNKRINHVLHSTPDMKKPKEKSNIKIKENLTLKQKTKPLEANINVKKQPLKLPKISRQKMTQHGHHARSIGQNLKQNILQNIRQKRERTYVHDRQSEKKKRSLLIESRQVKILTPYYDSKTIQSLLDEEALIQLKKLNDFQTIVQQMQIKRQQQIEEQEILQKSRHFRKGVTVHY